MVHYSFEWDDEKARTNEQKHGVSFDEAKSCFLDVFAIGCNMKKKPVPVDVDPLGREFDFSRSRPNPYWLGVVDRSCVRLIDKDLVELFPDNESVNAALRMIAEAATRARRSPVSGRRVSVARKK